MTAAKKMIPGTQSFLIEPSRSKTVFVFQIYKGNFEMASRADATMVPAVVLASARAAGPPASRLEKNAFSSGFRVDFFRVLYKNIGRRRK